MMDILLQFSQMDHVPVLCFVLWEMLQLWKRNILVLCVAVLGLWDILGAHLFSFVTLYASIEIEKAFISVCMLSIIILVSLVLVAALP